MRDSAEPWASGRAVDCSGLEPRRSSRGSVGSNPTSPATNVAWSNSKRQEGTRSAIGSSAAVPTMPQARIRPRPPVSAGRYRQRALSSAEEHCLDTAVAEGSIPSAPTISQNILAARMTVPGGKSRGRKAHDARTITPWGVSSVGRASRLHRECRRFEPVTPYHIEQKKVSPYAVVAQ